MITATVSPSKPTRVLQVVTHLGLGGAQRVALSVVHELRADYDFGVFAAHGQDENALGSAMAAELAAAGVPCFRGPRWPMKLGGMLPGAVALARAIRDFRPDLIHYHTEIPEVCGAVLRWSHLGPALPEVRTIHNCIFWRFWPRIGSWCDRRLSDAHIACVSEAARAEFERYRRASGARPAQPIVIPNGVALAPRPPRTQPHDPAARRILFAGRFTAQKGTDVLARALPMVALEPGVRAELVLVGTGDHAAQLHALALRPPAGWRVEVRPPVASLPDLFSEFDLLVMPSRFEGLPLVFVEAALGGLPVVAATAPGLIEAMPPDQPWGFAPGDASALAVQLSVALRETSRWSSVATAAQAFALARFSPRTMGDGYRRLYAQALGRG